MHSFEKTQELNAQYVILSAHRARRSDHANEMRTLSLRGMLCAHGATFKPVVGCYGDLAEASFLIQLNEAMTLDDVEALARGFDQESVLILGEHGPRGRPAKLWYVTGDIVDMTEDLGMFKPISPHQLSDHSAYTYDPSTGVYYVAE